MTVVIVIVVAVAVVTVVTEVTVVTKQILSLFFSSSFFPLNIVTKLKNSNCDKTKKNLIVTKLKNSNCDGSNSDSCDNSS